MIRFHFCFLYGSNCHTYIKEKAGIRICEGVSSIATNSNVCPFVVAAGKPVLIGKKDQQPQRRD